MIKLHRCPICDSDKIPVLKEYRYERPAHISREVIPSADISYVEERTWLFLEYIWPDDEPAVISLHGCSACGFLFSNPRQTDEQIEKIFSVVNELGIPKWRQAHNPPQRMSERAGRIFKLISDCSSPPLSSRDVLDYGGRQGFNLVPFVDAGNHCFVLDYVDVELARGVQLLGCNLSDIEPDRTFDLILLCHVLEHVREPLQMLEDLSRHLKPDGLLYVEVPLGAHAEWDHLSEPMTHVNFFSEESLYKALHMAGLSVRHLSTQRQWITHGPMTCLNIIGSPTTRRDAVFQFRGTHQQMRYPRMTAIRYLKKLKRSIRSLIRA